MSIFNRHHVKLFWRGPLAHPAMEPSPSRPDLASLESREAVFAEAMRLIGDDAVHPARRNKVLEELFRTSRRSEDQFDAWTLGWKSDTANRPFMIQLLREAMERFSDDERQRLLENVETAWRSSRDGNERRLALRLLLRERTVAVLDIVRGTPNGADLAVPCFAYEIDAIEAAGTLGPFRDYLVGVIEGEISFFSRVTAYRLIVRWNEVGDSVGPDAIHRRIASGEASPVERLHLGIALSCMESSDLDELIEASWMRRASR